MAFAPGGTVLASASGDKTARVWDPENTAPLTPPLRHLKNVARVQFTPNQRQLITSDAEGFTCAWRLPIDERPVEYLKELADILSGGESTPDAKATESLSERWKRLRARYPEDFTTPKSNVLRWHEFRAETAELQEDWFAAEFHLKRLIRLAPDDPAFPSRLAKIKEQQKHN